jgi:hypothetical protein
LDYDVCENKLWQDEQKSQKSGFAIRKDFARWLIFLLIGVITPLVACVIDIVIEILSLHKFKFLKDVVNKNIVNGDLIIPYLYWIVLNVIPVTIGSILVTYIEVKRKVVGMFSHKLKKKKLSNFPARGRRKWNTAGQVLLEWRQSSTSSAN